MKLAIVSDIHANAPALKAVLADMKTQGVSEIWNLGDIVGYAPFPNEVVGFLRKENVKSVIGNYDLKVLQFSQNRKKWAGKKDPAKFFSFEWTEHGLSPASRHYLQKLPDQLTLTFGGKNFLLVHGSPERNDEPLAPDTPQERFEELIRNVKADVILCGHSHRSFVRVVGERWFVNPGSVGRSFDGDRRASYLIIETKDDKMSFHSRRVDYPAKETLAKMREQHFPTELVESLELGLSLDDLKARPAARNDAGILNRVLDMAAALRYEKEHSSQVTALALQLFDQVVEVHQLSGQERLWLQVAGLLHDIGWVHGQQGHHKTGRDMVLQAKNFPFPTEIQTVIALLVRYHRRSLPQDNHKYFCDLSPELRLVVRKLAAILRIADGLDRSHASLVQELTCQVLPEKVMVKIHSSEPCEWEKRTAKEKADLFSEVFGREIVFG